MYLIAIVLPAAVILGLAYVIYGRILCNLFQLDPKKTTPAVELNDGVDFEPLAPSSLVPQHFSAIAAAGPIVGPILAGIQFGWVPALIWIVIGSIFIGGVHDFASLVASIRHKARSIAEVVRDHMSQRSYLLFLTFIWIALVYIIVAFTDITASSFVGPALAENGGVGGGAIASSSVMYLLLTLLMGVCLRFFKTPMGWTTAAFVLLTGVSIWLGPKLPFELKIPGLSPQKSWDVMLLVYCLLAGVAPVWLILQPRGQLGGYFLYFALAAGAVGILFGGFTADYPMFLAPKTPSSPTLFPMLFIMIACGACSGFHSLIASGTTSKQLKVETDAKVVGYGSMLLEALVAIMSLCCVMMFAQGSPKLATTPNEIYAYGIERFVSVLQFSGGYGISPQFARTFALMAFTTFVYDTLDVCTRLGRYILEELSGMHNTLGRVIGTALTAGVPLYFLLTYPAAAKEPIWRSFWSLFGASNQLLAALTLLGITVWLWKTRRAAWVWVVTGIPTVWMYTMSTWALVALTVPKFYKDNKLVFPVDLVAWAGVVLLVLALLMLLEAINVLLSLRGPPQGSRQPAGLPVPG